MRALAVRDATWALKRPFVIARGAVSAVDVVQFELRESGARGRGECRPYPRYGESPASVRAQIESARTAVEGGADRNELLALLPPGAARNAVDGALWDLEAKRSKQPAWRLAGVAAPARTPTAVTIGLDTPEAMAREAAAVAALPLLKLKLGGDGDLERVRAVRAAAPDATLIADANESWRERDVEAWLAELAGLRVDLVEQPLPAGADSALASIRRAVPVCADESIHGLATLERVLGRYDAINVKLDKTGGLTEALALVARARAAGLRVMVGCMVSSSLAIAPATLLMAGADWVDLDGPMWLARDEEPHLAFEAGSIAPADPSLWG